MRQFTEVLLLAAHTPLLVNGLKALHSTVKHDALRKGGTIRGLLDTRQTYYYCLSGEFICETTHCCDIGWECCRDGGCCQPQTYCDLASNGIIGCCPDGEVCTGPAGDPETIRPDPTPTPTTIFSTSTSTKRLTTSSRSTSTSTSTTTFTTLVGAPTPSAGATIIEVSALDVNITWSENWVQGTSACGPSVTSKSTSTGGSSFTYIFSSTQNYGYSYYFNVVNYNTEWVVFLNGVSQQTYFADFTTNCTYFQSSLSPFSESASQNITLMVYGSDSIDPSLSDPWSFQFNKLLIQVPNALPTSTTLGGLGGLTQTPGTPTGLALSASERARPYRPLLVYAGILLALLYCA